MSNPDEDLSPIDPALLDAVMGGTATDEQITTALQQIQSSIDDIKKGSNNNNNWVQQLLPLMLFAAFGGSFNASYNGGQFSASYNGGTDYWRHRRR